MQLSDFNYVLPENLIAKYPLAKRSQSRLLHLDSAGQCHDRNFTDISSLFNKGDVLVLNDTKVMKARLFALRSSGGKVELLIERITSTNTAIAHIKASNSPKQGAQLKLVFDGLQPSSPLTVTGRQNNLYTISAEQPIMQLLEHYGHLPLPPYFNRDSEVLDDSRYQTVFNNDAKLASVAAPTAGLHFDKPTLQALKNNGIIITTVTLHVGSGTFLPVRTNNIAEHHMHSEWGEVSAECVATINHAKTQGNKVIAVGTTATRALESAAKTHNGQLKPWHGETDIFIYPGVQMHVIDRLITNFHLPESTLLMLVSAIAGRKTILAAYRHAIEQSYRFFSYGDAMLIDQPSTKL